MQTRIQIKTCISRYDNVAYIRIQFLRAANYSVGAHSALVHEINCDLDDDDDETTDAGEEVAEAQTVDDPQQNDVCEVCLVAAWSKLNNSNSDARSVARKTRWCCGCSSYPSRRLTFLLSVSLSVTFMNCDHIFLVQ